MARTIKDGPSLTKELAADEKVIWKGAPETFPLMTEDNKKGLTTRWLVSIILAVVFIALYIVLSAKASDGINAWLLILVLLGVAYFAFLPIMDKNNVYKKCKYYITDRRVILELAERDYFSLPLTGLKKDIVPAEEGCIHVDLGACAGIAAAKRRICALLPRKDDKNNVCGFVLYNVEDSAELRAALNK